MLSLLVLALATLSSQAQKLDGAAVRQLVESRNFVFRPQTVQPLGGNSRQVTPDYDLRFYGDSVISVLPYFGRAYTAPADPNAGGIRFTSTDFSYEARQGKKKRWEVLVQPHDAQDVRQMILTITESGSATLSVISNNRQAISFTGYITPRK